MKFLDVNQHLSELDEHIRVLKSYGDVFEAVEARITRVINMDGAFKGEGAKGVIYNHAHMQLPTIRSIRAFLISFSETLEKMKAKINEYEPASNGSVSEDFWKNQLPKAYDRYEETLEEREATINQATAQVSHILHLGKLQTGDVYNSVDSARKHADTVLEGLYDLDQAGVELMAQVRTKMEELKATIRKVLDWTMTGGVTMKGVSIMEVGGYFANNATLHEKAPEGSVKISTPNPLVQYANNFPLRFKYDTMHSIMKVFDLSHHQKWLFDRIKSLPLTSLFNVAHTPPVREQSIWAYANAHYSGDKETVERAAEAIREIREGEEAYDPLRTFSFLLDFAPFIGNAKAAQEASLGVDLITGQELDEWDRGIAAASIFLGGIGKVGGRALKNIVKGSDDLADATRIADSQATGGTINNLDKGTGNFEGTLRGEKVILKDVRIQEIVYNKRTPEETTLLRREFNSIRKNYLKDLANDPKIVVQLRGAGLSKADIALMKNGRVPIGWQVHHKLPLDDGGTNSYDNLVLIKNEPYHKVITNAQMGETRGLKPGESKTINWPIPDGFVYPKKLD
ncbi:T7SS effector LXG polymorphic toxin [Halalkalibacterium halodurans]|uniref:T7SS effector LXG polymorphic toxin n=1 Tax=Halalkalibacterium halodurans TaxID=86665 RepID=UPI002AAA1C09|nr:T7SS effector LXG polymorphic toxin [Halalkalibacterium halodurans]MDY7224508.1 T7SS effector LXG polymorphic toxin [Halalkalibacterium halodurans]MDY7243793.1 T7SS effector LXG polymorphic toxin [Halalkalibacterium halodurans]